MLEGKTLIVHINLVLLHDFNKNDKMILNHIIIDEAPTIIQKIFEANSSFHVK